jgi:hypothetical protein
MEGMKMNTYKIIIILNSIVVLGYGIWIVTANPIVSSKDWMIIFMNAMSILINMLAEIKNPSKKDTNV